MARERRMLPKARIWNPSASQSLSSRSLLRSPSVPPPVTSSTSTSPTTGNKKKCQSWEVEVRKTSDVAVTFGSLMSHHGCTRLPRLVTQASGFYFQVLLTAVAEDLEIQKLVTSRKTSGRRESRDLQESVFFALTSHDSDLWSPDDSSGSRG